MSLDMTSREVSAVGSKGGTHFLGAHRLKLAAATVPSQNGSRHHTGLTVRERADSCAA